MRATTKQEAIVKLVATARAEIGYRESGNNYTKYAADPMITRLYGWSPQNQPWCCTFVTWCFLTAFGYDIGSRLTYGGTAACANSAQLFRNAGAYVYFPQVGDQAFFYSGGGINHTGIVVAVDGTLFRTVEGNYSDKVSLVEHNTGSADVAGFGRPNWDLFGSGDPKQNVQDSGKDAQTKPAVSGSDTQEKDEAKGQPYTVSLRTLRRGDKGIRVERLQQLLIARGYWCGGRTFSGRETADGDFGAATEVAVKDVQLAANIKQDGIVGADTMTVLLTT